MHGNDIWAIQQSRQNKLQDSVTRISFLQNRCQNVFIVKYVIHFAIIDTSFTKYHYQTVEYIALSSLGDTVNMKLAHEMSLYNTPLRLISGGHSFFLNGTISKTDLTNSCVHITGTKVTVSLHLPASLPSLHLMRGFPLRGHQTRGSEVFSDRLAQVLSCGSYFLFI